jgi:hypothetical protein
MTTSGMPGTAPAGSVISGTYRLTAGASSGAAAMRLSSFTYTAGTTYNFTFTGMQGSQTLALYVYQYNSAGTASSIEFQVEWTDNHTGIGGATEGVDGTLSISLSTLEATGTLLPGGSGNFQVTTPTIQITTAPTT